MFSRIKKTNASQEMAKSLHALVLLYAAQLIHPLAALVVALVVIYKVSWGGE